MSAANWAEVLSRLAAAGKDPRTVSKELEGIGLIGGQVAIFPLTPGDALEMALLHQRTRDRGLSLGDRACLALGRRLRLPVLTTDRAWAALDVSVAVKVIR